jgi:hypothetical protein
MASPKRQALTASPRTFEGAFEEIYKEAFKLLVDKQRRYGDSNIEQLGLHGVISRIAHDKTARAKKFLNGRIENGVVILDKLPDGQDESMEDTLLDIANYSLIAVALLRGEWGHPMKENVNTDKI